MNIYIRCGTLNNELVWTDCKNNSTIFYYKEIENELHARCETCCFFESMYTKLISKKQYLNYIKTRIL